MTVVSKALNAVFRDQSCVATSVLFVFLIQRIWLWRNQLHAVEYHTNQRRSFSKQVEGLNRKTAQRTIKILEFPHFYPDLTHFLAQVNDFMPFLTQVEGAEAPQSPK